MSMLDRPETSIKKKKSTESEVKGMPKKRGDKTSIERQTLGEREAQKQCEGKRNRPKTEQCPNSRRKREGSLTASKHRRRAESGVAQEGGSFVGKGLKKKILPSKERDLEKNRKGLTREKRSTLEVAESRQANDWRRLRLNYRAKWKKNGTKTNLPFGKDTTR